MMRKLRTVCIVLNLITGVMSAARHDMRGVLLSTFLLGGLMFVSKLEDDNNGK